MTIFQFPTTGIDLFTPNLINDITVVNAIHVTDLRQAIVEIEKALIGVTPLAYTNTNIIQDGYNVRLALETLDYHLYAMEQQLGFIFSGVDGYASRIDQIEGEFKAHRSENSDTDAYGYSVHGVDGYVVGTDNFQELANKKVDSGTSHVGPKFIARSSLADAGNKQIEVYGADGYLKAWIDEGGNAFFAGDLDIGGDGYIIDFQRIMKHLIVDGYTILGDNPTLDYTEINGPLTIYGTGVTPTLQLSNAGNFSVYGPNATLGDGTGLLDLNYTLSEFSGDGYFNGALTAAGPVLLGNPAGSNPITIKGSILHSFGNIDTTGEFRALGTQFRVEGTTTTISTNDFVVNSATSIFGQITLDGPNGNIVADGYNYSFGYYPTRSTNTFEVNANALIEDLIVTQDIQVTSGSIITPSLQASSATISGPLTIQDGSQGNLGYVWTAQDAYGTGIWAPPSIIRWRGVVTDGYQAIDAYGTTTLTPTGFFNAQSNDEVYANASSGPFTINLPQDPLIGDRVRFIDFNGGWSSINRVFVFPNSTNIIKTFAPADVDVTQDTITITSHGLVTGHRGVVSTTGTLPASAPPLTGNVFVRTIDLNTIYLYTTLASAQAGGPTNRIDFTTQGTGTHKFTTGTIMSSGFLELDVPNGWAETMYNGSEWRVITS